MKENLKVNTEENEEVNIIDKSQSGALVSQSGAVNRAREQHDVI